MENLDTRVKSHPIYVYGGAIALGITVAFAALNTGLSLFGRTIVSSDEVRQNERERGDLAKSKTELESTLKGLQRDNEALRLARTKDGLGSPELERRVQELQASNVALQQELKNALAEVNKSGTSSASEERLRAAEQELAAASKVLQDRGRDIERLTAENARLRREATSASTAPQKSSAKRTELTMSIGEAVRVSDDLTVTADHFQIGLGLGLKVNGANHNLLKVGNRISLSPRNSPEFCYLEVLQVPQQNNTRGARDVRVDYVCRPR